MYILAQGIHAAGALFIICTAKQMLLAIVSMQGLESMDLLPRRFLTYRDLWSAYRPPHPPLVACCCLTDILLRIYLWNGFWCGRLLLRKEDCAKYCQICSSQVNLTEWNALLVSVEEMYMFSLITCEHYVFVYF